MSEAADSTEYNPVLGLMKFGAAARLKELVTQGHLYMNSLTHFRKLDADPVRGDRDEALTHCYQPARTVMEVRARDVWHRVGGLVGPIKFREESESTGNLYCMFALRESHAEAHSGEARPLVDERNRQFGDSAVVITDCDEFLRRVTVAAKREGLALRMGLVEYVDEETYHGPMGPFRKFSGYSYQSEFRVLAEPGCAAPRSLMLGSIEDIAVPVSADINRILRVRSDGGRPSVPRDNG